MRVACTVPRHYTTRDEKLKWCRRVLRELQDSDGGQVDLLVLPQEYFGGVVTMPHDRHIELSWMQDVFGQIAHDFSVHIAVGAAVVCGDYGMATEDYLYFDADGQMVGSHRKYALPNYDDVRFGGDGNLWPETSFARRATPVELPALKARVGTVFCWEVFSQALWPAYSYAGVDVVVHPIKFAPRAWPRLTPRGDGPRRVVEFAQDKKSDVWEDRLIAASRYQVFCPILVSCNTWALGNEYMALTGVVDEVQGCTELVHVPSGEADEHVHVDDIQHGASRAFDGNLHAATWGKAMGGLHGYSAAKKYTMAHKMRRIEAQLVGGTLGMDSALAMAAQHRQKTTTRRAFEKLLGELQQLPLLDESSAGATIDVHDRTKEDA